MDANWLKQYLRVRTLDANWLKQHLHVRTDADWLKQYLRLRTDANWSKQYIHVRTDANWLKQYLRVRTDANWLKQYLRVRTFGCKLVKTVSTAHLIISVYYAKIEVSFTPQGRLTLYTATAASAGLPRLNKVSLKVEAFSQIS